MAHEDVLTVFVIVTALAVVMQAAILYAIFQALRQLRDAVIRVDAGIQEHFHPLLRTLGNIAQAAREPVGSILANLADISGVLRDRTHAVDAVAGELVERFRAEAVRADELLTAALQKVQRATEAMERGVLTPIRELSALLAGVRSGVEFFLGRRRRPKGERAPQEEELFI
jgi:methyl-accepting chemotaxis protein